MNLPKLLIVLVVFLFLASTANAQYKDDDGILVLQWGPPDDGNPVSHYVINYNVNNDSTIQVETAQLEDSTVVLANYGNFCVANIFAISIFSDTSIAVIPDTAYYASSTGIGPPTGVIWKPQQ